VSFSKNASGSDAKWKWAFLGILTIAIALIWRPGCRYYPPITSPEGMQVVKLLYTACNTQDPVRLSQAQQQLSALQAQGKITGRELAAFESIIQLAKAGEWKKAEMQSYRFVEDQVGRGHPAPERRPHDHHAH
jgi:hypothetical protein